MPQITPIDAIRFAPSHGRDISALIAPPYDVLDERSKADLLAAGDGNIVAVDLPHLPAKTVGPDETYQQAGQRFERMLQSGVLQRDAQPALFVYRQTFQPPDGSSDSTSQTMQRLGLFANVRLQEFGPGRDGGGGVFPHEQTFSGPKEDRLKLMRATKAQLSPIFGLCPDNGSEMANLLQKVAAGGEPDHFGTTSWDGVKHELWAVDDAQVVGEFQSALASEDVFIADGHHRYNTALNYRRELTEASGTLPEDHPANRCLFVLVSMNDPGLFIGPTHRVIGGMVNFSLDRFEQASAGRLSVNRFEGDPIALEAELANTGPHAIGLYAHSGNGSAPDLAIATTTDPDPLATTHGSTAAACRQLDVAIAQHLIVEQICEPNFAPPGITLSWKFPHTVSELADQCRSAPDQLGLIMRPTTLQEVRKVSEAGELMPQKSTFFYPKVATGLVINPLV